VIDNFIATDAAPSGMVLDAIPVDPPDLAANGAALMVALSHQRLNDIIAG